MVPETEALQGDGFMARVTGVALIVVQGLRARRGQSLLTLSTMAIGALGLAATLFIGQGALDGLWQDLDRLMGNRLDVYPDGGANDILLQRRAEVHFTDDDLEQVRKHVPAAKYIAPLLVTRQQVEFGRSRGIMAVDGIPDVLEREQAYLPVQGHGFSDHGRSGLIPECLLTRSAATDLELDISAQPKLHIGAHWCTVVGLIPDPPGADSRFQRRVAIPYTLARMLWGSPRDIGLIVVGWRSPADMESVVRRVRKILDEVRAPGSYHLSSSQFAITKRKNIVGNFMVFGSAQALFSVLVAAIGIVNVMLSNVVRRAREFAIRVAMGARQSDLAVIVLIESALLGFLGAALGVAIAMLAAPWICDLISRVTPEATELAPLFNWEGVTVPLLVCTASGLLAGIVPALKTRQMDILSVLRAE